MTVLTGLVCADCGFTAREIGPAALKKGSDVREPGEALCAGCSSRRVLMVRELARIPNSLIEIKAMRMVRGAA